MDNTYYTIIEKLLDIDTELYSEAIKVYHEAQRNTINELING